MGKLHVKIQSWHTECWERKKPGIVIWEMCLISDVLFACILRLITMYCMISGDLKLTLYNIRESESVRVKKNHNSLPHFEDHTFFVYPIVIIG